jgi:hypothetical protein
MKPQVAAILVAVALSAVAVLHAYWGIRGEFGRSAAVPEVDGRPLFLPSRAACFAVAALLAVAVWVLLIGGELLPDLGQRWLGVVGPVAVGLVLLARAVGDFRYVGFFKRVHDSRFAVLDSRFFSPLCLVLGLGALWSVLGKGK